MGKHVVLILLLLSACAHRVPFRYQATPIEHHAGGPYSVVGKRTTFSHNGLLISVQEIEPSQVPELTLPRAYPPPYHMWPARPLTFFLVQVINRTRTTIEWNPRNSALYTNSGMRLPLLDRGNFHQLGIDGALAEQLFYTRNESFSPSESRVKIIAFPPLPSGAKAFQLRLTNLFVGGEEAPIGFFFSVTKVALDSPRSLNASSP